MSKREGPSRSEKAEKSEENSVLVAGSTGEGLAVEESLEAKRRAEREMAWEERTPAAPIFPPEKRIDVDN